MTTQLQPVTWRDVAEKRPTLMQAYEREHGPMPDGPVTADAWNTFYGWVLDRTHGAGR